MRCRITLFILIFQTVLLTAAGAAPFDSPKLIAAAIAEAEYTKGYDGSYSVIPYPGGDVAKEAGVCTDVIIRAYRALGIDLQQRVHEDMKNNFNLYPKLWGLRTTDTNIDHRRVPNLQLFFTRHGQKLAVSDKPSDYKPGDIVTWDLTWPRRPLPHIGIVTDRKSADGSRPLMVHNIGRGVQVEDMLFDYKITGHYRYAPEQ
jgi:uncharacterized protein YijF (DUF1287 family)